MRILKYVFLLSLLFSIAFVVFVATQPGDYKIKRSKEIKISKDVVFNFVADSSSISYWSPWLENEADFTSETLFKKDSITQKLLVNKEENNSVLQFQKTKNGTLIVWELKGKLNFNLKMLSVLKGGIDNVLGNDLEEGLKNIDNYLVKELTTYNIKIHGLVTKHATNYIQQIDSCAVVDFQKKSKEMLQNMLSFVAKNDINIIGLPFIVYENKRTVNNTTIFAMCVPVEEEILTTEGSEISGGSFDEFLAVKTTLTGDYSHLEEAWKKSADYITTKKIIEDFAGKHIEIYKVSLPKERKPSKWVTEIYVPIKKKVFKPRVVKKVETEQVETPPLITPVEIPQNR